ncbi:MAG: hydroxymethylbilane synthase [Gammaproteobacteria bacterium]|nr:hydroxymethylbilane synthase [Gammaproteobacteria bacterium]
MSSPTHLRIATRQSPLALWQANHARDQLLAHWPTLTIELLPITTSGDRFQNAKLLDIGGKSLFVKELEEALLDKRADLAVHSMKDMPATLPDGLALPIIFARQNPLDAFVSNQFPTLKSLPKGAIVGTGSLRRASQLLALRPDLNIKSIRGNINTRLKKLETEDYHAIILAAAGLERLALDTRIQETLPENIMLPAPGQGALGIECRTDDIALQQLLAPLHDTHTASTVAAERKVNKTLGGSCHSPVAIYCRASAKNQLQLSALVASPDGKTVIQDTQIGPKNKALELADASVTALKEKGVLACLRSHE